MKNLLLMFVILSGCAFGQVSPQIQGAGAPTNPCYNGGQQYVDTTNHVIYGCPSSGSNWANLSLGNTQPTNIRSLAADPSTCSTADTNGNNNIYYNTVSAAYKYCSATNTWSAFGSGGAVSSVFTRTGAVVAASGDYTAAQVTNAVANNAANAFTAAGTLNLNLASPTAGFILPVAAGASPTASGAMAYNSTTATPVIAGNGATFTLAMAASGGTTGTTCSNQFISAVSGNAVPTCTTVTAAMVTNAMVTNSGNTGAAGWNLNASAATGVNALRIPVQAGCTAAGATGDLCYDSTGAKTHVMTNGADSLTQTKIVTQTDTISGADYTNATTTPSTVFTFTLPATTAAANYKYDCSMLWESTAATLVGPVFGLNLSAAPTQLTGSASVQNTLAGADTNGYLSNTTTGSQTLVTSAAAGVTSTNYWAHIWGTIEGAAAAGSTFIINAASTSGSTALLNIRRGGICTLTWQ